MMPKPSADNLLADEFEPGFVRPNYEEYCFANVSPTVIDLLGVDIGRTLPADVFDGVDTDVSNVLVVLIDGLRYDRWLESDAPLFERARVRGRTTPLTSVYPSETAAAMITYHTGTQPVEHGSLGWEQYLSEHQDTIEPLKGRTVDRRPFSEAFGDDPVELFSGRTIHEKLGDEGISTAVVQPKRTISHEAAPQIYAGTERVPYKSPAEGAIEAAEKVQQPDHSFVHIYYPDLDGVSHRGGTRAPHYEATLHMLANCLERALESLDPAVAADTLLLFAADHGHFDTNTDVGTVLTDRQAVTESLARRDDGELVMPSGGSRNAHLHLRDGTVETVREALSDLDAHILTKTEAIERNLFGDGEPSEVFDRRCGDLVIVPNEEPVWYDPAKFDMVGQHGGLHPEEMIVPFTAVNVDTLLES